ncbi:hypothetical protein SDD30_15325 [Moorella naiadis]|uniref:homing endonuclease associated repeat-containing protein n=1 Tax=Moorella naiadis (nom. illeg.) TaxID=3093670 RepID=UPI003D9CA9A4
MALRETAGDCRGYSCRRSVAWNEEELILALREKGKELGRTPRQQDFAVGSPSATVFYQVFGSWNKALDAAGFAPNRITKRQRRQGTNIDKEECARALRRLSETLGGIRPAILDVMSSAGISVSCPAARTIIKHFGSFKNALEYAGLDKLPGRRQLLKLKQRSVFAEFFDEIAAGRKFLLRTEIPLGNLDSRYRYFREYAQEKGIVIINKKTYGSVKIVMDWLRGIEALGFLPEEKKIAEEMGDRAFGYLMRFVGGESLQDIGISEGMTRERIRQIINKEAQKAVTVLTGIVVEPEKKKWREQKYQGRLVAKKNSRGISLLLLARIAKNVSVEELVKKTNCTNPTIYRAQKGLRVQYGTAVKISGALGYQVKQLFAETNNQI